MLNVTRPANIPCVAWQRADIISAGDYGTASERCCDERVGRLGAPDSGRKHSI